ncbi:MAG: hypothetical protein B5M56_01010 [Desulfococcus sp. 4484_241]|nr:MAG: hypothetical protein B5M56_01010 [Desulfococcus sp. 4484_241]
MAEYHITIRLNRWLLPAVCCLLLVIAAVMVFLFVAYSQGKIGVMVKLKGQQQIKVRMAASFPVTADIDQMLKIPVKGRASLSVPVNQSVTVPFKKNLTVPVELDTMIPINLDVPLNLKIPIDTSVFVDTRVKTSVLGIPLTVPVKGYFPIKATIPVVQMLPIRDKIKLQLKTPVKAAINDHFEIPIDTLFSVDVPLDMMIKVPFKNRVMANISLDGKVVNQIPNLYILDNTLEIGLDQLRLVWRDNQKIGKQPDKE